MPDRVHLVETDQGRGRCAFQMGCDGRASDICFSVIMGAVFLLQWSSSQSQLKYLIPPFMFWTFLQYFFVV